MPIVKGKLMRFMGMEVVEDPTLPPDTIRLDPGSVNTIAHSSDRADALANYERMLQEYQAARAAEERQRLGRRSGINVEIRRRDDTMRSEAHIEIRDMRCGVTIDETEMTGAEVGRRQAYIGHLARQAARLLERQIAEQLAEAYQRSLTQAYGGGNLTVEALRHARDVLGGAMSRRAERTEEPIQALADIEHRVIEHRGLKAELLDTTEKTWAEGETMQHCFGKSYSQKVVAGDYIAYHISGGALPKSGLTLGFSKAGDKWAFDQIKGKKNDTAHCRHPEVLEMIEHVHKLIGKTEKRRLPDEIDARMQIRANWAFGAVRTDA